MNHFMLVDNKGKIRAEGNSKVALERFSTDIQDKIYECTQLGNVDVTEYSDEDTGAIHLSRIERGLE